MTLICGLCGFESEGGTTPTGNPTCPKCQVVLRPRRPEETPMPMNYPGVRPAGERVHLGDGAYAQFDGYQIWLFANSPHSSHRVALEPGAFTNLIEYAKRYWIFPK